LKTERWGVTTGSREVPGIKPVTRDNNDDDDDDNNNNTNTNNNTTTTNNNNNLHELSSYNTGGYLPINARLLRW
jgi:hypothetical protein